MQGTTIWFNKDKGYGFVSADGKDYFVHWSNIASEPGSFKKLDPEQRVEFDVAPDKRNPHRQQAVNVRPV